MPKTKYSRQGQSRKASQFQARQSSQARQSRQTRRVSPLRPLRPTVNHIHKTPSYMYNRILQYSGIDYPHHIRSANEFVVRQDRRLPDRLIQNTYANQPIELNFQNQNQHPLPLHELRRRINENEFRRRQLVDIPFTDYQLETFYSKEDTYWDAYLYFNPSKRPADYQLPTADLIEIYNSNYNGPREIAYQPSSFIYERLNEDRIRTDQDFQQNAHLFFNPSKRPADYRIPTEFEIFRYDKNYNGPREITYEYQDPIIRERHANFIRVKRYVDA